MVGGCTEPSRRSLSEPTHGANTSPVRLPKASNLKQRREVANTVTFRVAPMIIERGAHNRCGGPQRPIRRVGHRE